MAVTNLRGIYYVINVNNLLLYTITMTQNFDIIVHVVNNRNIFFEILLHGYGPETLLI